MTADTIPAGNSRRRFKTMALLSLLLVAARVLFITLMPAVYSRDLHAWLKVISLLELGKNPYVETAVLNWPPFWMQGLYAIHSVAGFLNVSDTVMIQAVLISSELVILWLVAGLMDWRHQSRLSLQTILLGLVLNPCLIFLSCQHCNFDVIVGLVILVAVKAVMKFNAGRDPVDWLIACFALGIGIWIKTIPVVLLPLLLIHIRSIPVRARVFGAALVAFPVIIALSVIIPLAPVDILNKVLRYRSMGGWYGFVGIFSILDLSDAILLFQKISPALLGLLIIYWCRRCLSSREFTSTQILRIAILLLLFIPTFGPGYSPTYLLWYIALVVLFYPFAPGRLKWMIVSLFIVTVATYTAEYALLNSHGAFLCAMFPDLGAYMEFNNRGGRIDQAWLRMPMFVMNVAFYISLARSKALNSGDQQTAVRRVQVT